MKDWIDLATVQIDGSPDVRSWPATVAITRVDYLPSGGWTLTFDRPLPESWKWPSNPAVPSENYQATVWVIAPLADGYHGQGFIELWQGRAMGDGSLPSILDHFGPDGWMGHLGGPMASYQPKPGDKIGLMVTAGDARGRTDLTSVAERSNVVVVALTTGPQSVSFTDPVPVPVPTPEPPSEPPADLNLIDAVADLESQLANMQGRLDAVVAILGQLTSAVGALTTATGALAGHAAEVTFPIYDGKVFGATLTMKPRT